MTSTVRVPQWNDSGGEALLLHIHKKTGDFYKNGEVLFSYSWDGAELEERACEDGKVTAVLFSEGEMIEPGTPIMVTEIKKQCQTDGEGNKI